MVSAQTSLWACNRDIWAQNLRSNKLTNKSYKKMHQKKWFYSILSVDSADLPFWMQTTRSAIVLANWVYAKWLCTSFIRELNWKGVSIYICYHAAFKVLTFLSVESKPKRLANATNRYPYLLILASKSKYKGQ